MSVLTELDCLGDFHPKGVQHANKNYAGEVVLILGEVGGFQTVSRLLDVVGIDLLGAPTVPAADGVVCHVILLQHFYLVQVGE